MTHFMNLAHTLQTLLTEEADDLARQSGFVRRVRQLSGASFAQTLIFGWLHDSHASLDDLAERAADLGADVTPQALHQRITPSAIDFLAELLLASLHRVVVAGPTTLPLLQRFNGVYVFDTTTVTLPACLAPWFPGCGGRTADAGQAALKVHACLELSRGALDLATGAARQPDVCSELARAPLPPGALRLADRGFFDLDVLGDCTEQGIYWISRVPARLVIQQASGPSEQLAPFLDRQTADQLDCSVRVGQDGRLSCRLLARRVPAAVRAKRQQRLRRQAKKKGRPVSAAQWTLCGWNVYLTNLEAERLRWEELWVLARARWQIELLFKLWKSHGGLEALRGKRPERVLVELYAKLIGQLIQHWLLLTCGGPSVEYSHPKAARRIRQQAPLLVILLVVPAALAQRLERLAHRIQKRCRVQKRQGRPSTYQLLHDPDRAIEEDTQQQMELWDQAA